MYRIEAIDGLRTMAAFGVVWAHMWGFYHYPSIKFLSIDLYQVVAIVGNGVDFFFVISGFCMYLMIKQKVFNTKAYLHFLGKRFLRLAPAFYSAVVVYALIAEFTQHQFEFYYSVLFHFLFLNNIVTGNNISGPFWSIATEWHFYMVLPFILYIISKTSILKTLIVLSACSILLLCFVNAGYLSFRWWETQVLVRFPEFAAGILACHYYIKGLRLHSYFSGALGLFAAIFVMYTGRILKFTPVLDAAGESGFLLKSLSDTVMTTGFAILLFHVVTEKTFLSRILSWNPLTYLGRISYSIYLWHSMAIFL